MATLPLDDDFSNPATFANYQSYPVAPGDFPDGGAYIAGGKLSLDCLVDVGATQYNSVSVISGADPLASPCAWDTPAGFQLDVEAVTVPTSSGDSQPGVVISLNYIRLADSFQSAVYWSILPDRTIQATYWGYDDPGATVVWSDTYDATDHRWLRVEVTEDRTTRRWLASPDGSTWTEIATSAMEAIADDLAQASVYHADFTSGHSLVEFGQWRAALLGDEPPPDDEAVVDATGHKRGAQTAGRLSLVVTHADGRTTRWGPDELDASDIPTRLQFSTGLPGGFIDLVCELLRHIDVAQPDENELDTVQVLGPGGEIAWEGRLTQFPRQHGDDFTVHPGAEGWVAHLRDDTSFREIYVDADLTRWAGPGVAWRAATLAALADVDDASLVLDSTSPAVTCQLQTPWSRYHRSAAVYDARGIAIGSVYYSWSASTNIVGAATDANFNWVVWTDDADTFPSPTTTGDLQPAGAGAAGTGTGTLTAGASETFATAFFEYAAALTATSGVNYDLGWRALPVYGTHGLTKQGVATATQGQGFYASDVVADVVRRAAPLLRYSTGTDGSITPTGVVIPHLVFLEPTTAEEVIKKANASSLYEWGVYDNREFFYRPADPDRLTWTARLDEGARADLDGPSASDLINGVIVQYTDFTGTIGVVGPTGTPNMTATDDSLLDSSDTNPVNSHGIPRKTQTIQLSDPCDQDFAIATGAIYLQERGGPQRRGQVTLTGMVTHPTAGERPVWAIRAGDFIDITDSDDNTLGGPRRIIQTQYDHDTRSITLTLDNTAYTLDALLEILNAELVAGGVR